MTYQTQLPLIHKANLVNFGLLPLTFADPAEYDRIEEGDVIAVEDVHAGIDAGRIAMRKETKGSGSIRRSG